MPVGYNGRASSVVVSGTQVVRPSGQIKLPNEERPVFSATRKLDFELETAFVIGKPTELGQPISIENAWDHILEWYYSMTGQRAISSNGNMYL